MKEIRMLNQGLFSAIGGLLGIQFGELDGVLYALLAFMVFDYLTGVFAAVVEKQVSSHIGFKGLFKKVAILCLVSVAHLIDTAVLKEGGAIRTMVIFFYLSNEGLSILENVVRLGLPVPAKLEQILKQCHDKEEL